MNTSRRAVLAAGAVVLATDARTQTQASIDDLTAELVRRSETANAALMRGDVDGYRALIALSDDFTLMSPFGGAATRRSETDGDWHRIGRFFRNVTLRQDVVETYATPHMVVLVVIEHGHGEVGGLPPQDWPLRVTMVFRRDGVDWRLAHRRADPLARGITLEEVAELAA